MRKIIKVLGVTLLTFLLVACGKDDQEDEVIEEVTYEEVTVDPQEELIENIKQNYTHVVYSYDIQGEPPRKDDTVNGDEDWVIPPHIHYGYDHLILYNQPDTSPKIINLEHKDIEILRAVKHEEQHVIEVDVKLTNKATWPIYPLELLHVMEGYRELAFMPYNYPPILGGQTQEIKIYYPYNEDRGAHRQLHIRVPVYQLNEYQGKLPGEGEQEEAEEYNQYLENQEIQQPKDTTMQGVQETTMQGDDYTDATVVQPSQQPVAPPTEQEIVNTEEIVY